MFKILKDILATIKGLTQEQGRLKVANLIVNLLVAGGTIALAIASCYSIRSMKENTILTKDIAEIGRQNINLTKEIADRNWVPDLFWEDDNSTNIVTRPTGISRLAYGPVYWCNTGGSAALQIRKYSRMDPAKGPIFDTLDLRKDVSFIVWPHQRLPDYLSLGDSGRQKTKLPQYFHSVFWFKDLTGQNYLREAVYYFKLTPKKHYFYKDGVYLYDWKQNKWIGWEELIPDSATVRNNFGVNFEEQGKVEEAILEYRAASRLAPERAEIHYNLGLALGKTGKNEEAEKELREATRLKPDWAAAHSNLGIALKEQGKVEEAEKELREANRLNPDDAFTLGNMALLLNKKGMKKEAREYWEKALKVEKRPEAIEAIKKRLAEPG